MGTPLVEDDTLLHLHALVLAWRIMFEKVIYHSPFARVHKALQNGITSLVNGCSCTVLYISIDGDNLGLQYELKTAAFYLLKSEMVN